MDQHGKISRSDNNKTSYDQEDEMEVRRGPWSGDEDCALINYIAQHGEGRWNSLALCAGLKRTGKSCRLRWLNYLRPDLRRGDMTLEEQLLILELHSRWGNRWSKIAQHVPGRTDNEIKNYWRTRVQKQAKQLNCDVDSKQFKDAMRYLWMPRLVEKIQATNVITNNINQNMGRSQMLQPQPNNVSGELTCSPENSTATLSSPDSFETPISDLTECFNNYLVDNQYYYPTNYNGDESLLLSGSINDYSNQGLDFAAENKGWIDDGGDVSANLWNIDDIWFLQQ